MSILFIASLSSQHSLKIGTHTYLVSKPLFPLRCEIRSRVYCDMKQKWLTYRLQTSFNIDLKITHRGATKIPFSYISSYLSLFLIWAPTYTKHKLLFFFAWNSRWQLLHYIRIIKLVKKKIIIKKKPTASSVPT